MFGAELDSLLGRSDNAILAPRSQLIHTRRLCIQGRVRVVNFYVTKDRDRLQAARDLLNDRYGWRGYGSTYDIPSGANHTTFTAELDGQVIGTITLAVDGEGGLAIDETFGQEAGEARRNGAQPCELVKLAFDPTIRSKEVLASLFHIVFIYGTKISVCTDLFIEVTPRHVAFYQVMLGFQRCGSVRTHASVKIPCQLMRLEVESIRRSIRELAGRNGLHPSRSLYTHFFSPAQAAQVRRSLMLNEELALIGARAVSPERRYRALSTAGEAVPAPPLREADVQPTPAVRHAA